MATEFATLKVDTEDLKRLGRRLQELRALLGPELFDAVKPQFGAYMSYSKYLEQGTKKMPARPHIVPAVQAAMRSIVSDLLSFLLDTVLKVLASKSTISEAGIADKYRAVWTRTLNNMPRRIAVSNAPYEYGFHRRSIHGYAFDRTAGDIETQQLKAEQERKEKATLALQKKKHKKKK